ncbi:single-stranded DNA-binding protein [Candidatus Daviesbacteria bacterium]|nr:single-stranded DNA-binding protein [Candidatus Daviesbacteria bacterium]
MASRSWNRVELIGNLTRDPELRYTPNGAAVCTFGLATNRTFVSEGEKREEVDFHRLVSWNKLAELCNQLLRKGMRVFISGRLQTRSWEGQDGQTRNVTEIVIEDMIILTPKQNGEMVAEAADVTISAPPPARSTPPPSTKDDKEEEKEEEKKETVSAKPSKKEEISDEDLPF